MKAQKVVYETILLGPIPAKITKFLTSTQNTVKQARFVEIEFTKTVWPYEKGGKLIASWNYIWLRAKNSPEKSEWVYSGRPTWDPEKTLEPACHDLLIKTGA